MKKKFLYACLMSVLGLNVSAQDTADDFSFDDFDMSLEELMDVSVSVGSKTISSIEETPGTVYLIDQKDIRVSNAQNLRDLLNMFVPGLDALPSYFKYGNSATGVYNRGILSDFNQQVLILWNGENKFNDATFASPHLMGEYPLDNVERVEVNSSSPSPLLGGSAMITINIVTKEKSIEGTEVTFNSGISDTEGVLSKRVSAVMGKKVKDWRIGAGVQYFDDNGFNFSPDGAKTNGSVNGLRNGNQGSISLQLNVQSPNKKLEFGSSFRDVTKDAFLSSLTYSESSDLYQYQGQTWMNYLKYEITEGWEVSTGYANMMFRNTVDLEQFIPVGVNQTENIPYGININNGDFYVQTNYLKQFKAAGNHTLLAGLRYGNESQLSHSINVLGGNNTFEDQTAFRLNTYGVNIPDASRDVYTAFVEDNWKLSKKLSALLAVRGDVFRNFNDEFLNAINPRIGLVYKPADGWFVKGLYATAVRPPSLYELEGAKFLPLLYGNEEVGLENLSTYELNVVKKTEKLTVGLTGYYSLFQNRISYVPSALDTTISTASNSGETEIFGLEFNVNYQPTENTRFFVNGSNIISTNSETDEQTPYVASTFINTGLMHTQNKVDFLFTFNYRGGRTLEPQLVTNAEEFSSDHFNLNYSMNYNIDTDTRFYVMIQNVTDNDNWQPLSANGVAAPLNGRVFHFGVNHKF